MCIQFVGCPDSPGLASDEDYVRDPVGVPASSGDAAVVSECASWEEPDMIFTIGRKGTYNRGIKEAERRGGNFKKIGQVINENYPGGYAFKTAEDAQRRIDEAFDNSYGVYEVDADWDKDTAPSDVGWWSRLLITSRIVRQIKIRPGSLSKQSCAAPCRSS
jgi:hypothetical protein